MNVVELCVATQEFHQHSLMMIRVVQEDSQFLYYAFYIFKTLTDIAHVWIVAVSNIAVCLHMCTENIFFQNVL